MQRDSDKWAFAAGECRRAERGIGGGTEKKQRLGIEKLIRLVVKKAVVLIYRRLRARIRACFCLHSL